MSTPDEPDERREPEAPPASELDPRSEPFLFRLLRSAIAPPVLEDGGHDAPLSRRGRLLFWGTVAVLVGGIAVSLLLSSLR